MIYVGTSGFNYNEWRELFYPKIELVSNWIIYYAKYFNFLEFSDTEFKYVDPEYFYKLAEKTENSLKLSLVVNNEITHKNINAANIITNLAAAKKFSKLYNGINKEIWFFNVCLKFPFFFRFNSENFKKFRNIIEYFQEFRIAAEFQHITWMHKELINFLKEKKITLVSRDVPEFEEHPSLDDSEFTSNIGYFRFYGKNHKEWWQPREQFADTHYLYQTNELQQINKKIQNKLHGTSTSDSVFIFLNIKEANCIKNAKYFMKRFKCEPALGSEQLSLPLGFN